MIKLMAYATAALIAAAGSASVVVMSGLPEAQQQAAAAPKGDRLVHAMSPMKPEDRPVVVQTVPATPQNQDMFPEPKPAPVPTPQPKPKIEDVKPAEIIKPLAPWKPSKRATKPKADDNICTRHGGWKVVTGRSWHCEYGK